MADKIKLEYSRVPGALDPIEIPVGYADLHGDETEYGLKIAGGAATGLGTVHTTALTVPDTGLLLAAANPTRKSLLVINNDATNPLYLKGGPGPATPDSGSVKVRAGDSYTTDVTGDAYYGIAAAGQSISVTVEEIAVTWP